MSSGRAGMPVKWFHDGPSGTFRQADDIFQWLDWHIPADVLERARRGLVENIGPEQLARLVDRRTRQQCIEIHVPHPATMTPAAQLLATKMAHGSNGGGHGVHMGDVPGLALVIVRHWTPQPADVREFLERLGLTHAGIFVRFENLATEAVREIPATDYVRTADSD